MSEEILLSELKDHVLTLTLNRPKQRNALNPPLMRALHDALEDAAEDARVRVVVLRGAGQDFCAGGDIAAAKDANEKKELSAEEKVEEELRKAQRGPNSSEYMLNWLARSSDSSRLLNQIPKPTIAVLHGNVVGAGVGLATGCDFRVVADDTRFLASFIRVGYSGDFGGSYFMTKLVGPAKAREFYMLNERIDAQEAARLGLVTRLTTAEQADAAAQELAAKLAAFPPIALRYMKKNINTATDYPLERSFEVEVMNQHRAGATEDSKEAIRAMFEKREPVFQGK
jgi:2-(1,2-epoxy-1,2-dihydrophenyl)acetyl-CoA isomerase